ncbi:MAG: hypothetical protein ACE5KT_06060 [Methanosarcinales archaeon]
MCKVFWSEYKCPIFETESDINLGILKEFLDKLKWKDSKVFKNPSELKADKLLQLCMETIQRHDVRHIRTLHTKDNKIYETWYFISILTTSSVTPYCVRKQG